MQSFLQIETLNTVRKLPMTTLEDGLKSCIQQRPDIKSTILSASEMTEYITWMAENFGEQVEHKLSLSDIPSMLHGGDVAQISDDLLRTPGDKKALYGLSRLFEMSRENHFFSENRDITASRLLRYMPPYWHSVTYFDVYYAFSGTCPVMFENETVMLSPGTILIVPPGTRQACACLADDEILFVYMIRSSTFKDVFLNHLSTQNLLSLFFQQALNGQNNAAYLRFEIGQDGELEKLLYSIFEEYHSDKPYTAQMLNALMSIFFLIVLQRYEGTARLSKNNNLHWKPEFMDIFSYIQAQYQTVTLQQISSKFNYSERQIIRIVQNCTGKTFAQLLLQLRMEKAARMILARTASIDTISVEVGYATLSSFYRAFTRYFGCTPRIYLKENAGY